MTDFSISRRLPALWLVVALLVFCLRGVRADESTGIRAPDGFEVSLYASDELAHDIYAMTLDRHGRVVVAGRGYVKTLHDDDGDGRADRATTFSEKPKSGAHGLLFLGNDLLCTGDESLMLLRDVDGDGQADGAPEIWSKLRHPEHGANGLCRGPDGWIYLICGNDAGVATEHASTDGSPVKVPQSGAVLRFSPDGKQSEIVAHGLRNPYDLDFNADGHLFAVDADGERDHHLPWYAPTRLFDVAQGMHHGWVLNGWQRSWNRPPWMFDSVPRAAEIGRGSPTGLVVYQHEQFPGKYRDSVLSCCWTLGRVYCLPLTPRGASYEAQVEVFLETTGEVGFAPVDLAVGPQGDLFIAIGGRRTRGSVFRVRYVGGQEEDVANSDDSLTELLQTPQPLAAWSRAQWEPVARQFGRDAIRAAAVDGTRPTAERVRAVEIVTDLFGGMKPNEAASLLARAKGSNSQGADANRVAARGVWSLGRQPSTPATIAQLAAATWSQEPLIARSAWEAFAALPSLDPESEQVRETANWQGGLLSSDRRIRALALFADARRSELGTQFTSETELWRKHFRSGVTLDDFSTAVEVFLTATNEQTQLNAVRLMELALGDIDTHQMQNDVYAGYSVNAPRDEVARLAGRFGSQLAAQFPTSDADLNQELARLLGALQVEDEGLVERMTTHLDQQTSPANAVHYLIVLSRLPGKRSPEATSRTAMALAQLHPHMQAQGMYVSRNWPARVGEAVAKLFEHDMQLPAALIAQDDFRLPVQSIFAAAMNPEQRQSAARRLVKASPDPTDLETRWTEELVQLVGELPPAEAFAALRTAWDDFALRDAIVAVLARAPSEDDRGRFVETLSSIQPRSIEAAADALARLDPTTTDDELLAAMSALKQCCAAPDQRSTRQAIVRLLGHWTRQEFPVEEADGSQLLAAYAPWFDWFHSEHTILAGRLASFGGADATQWIERLKRVDLNAGNVERGELVYQKKSCVRCHSGSSRLGPDLAGAAGRFSREDLLGAIVDPSKDVAPLYQTTQVVTGSGRVYNGLIVYESPDGTLVQTAPDTTVRIAGDEIVAMRKSRTSLMPTGLLNGVSDEELADLLVYLKSLKGQR